MDTSARLCTKPCFVKHGSKLVTSQAPETQYMLTPAVGASAEEALRRVALHVAVQVRGSGAVIQKAHSQRSMHSSFWDTGCNTQLPVRVQL